MKTAFASILALALAVTVAEAGISVQGGLARDLSLEPGATHWDVVVVANTGDEPALIRIYLTDYVFLADGSNYYDEPGTRERSCMSWVSVSPDRLEIPPQGEARLALRIEIPDDADLTGVYWGMIMFEVEPDAPAVEPAVDQPSMSVRMVMRHALQVSVSLPGGEAAVTLEGRLVPGDDTGVQLEVDLASTGAILIKPEIWTEFYDATGVLVERIEGERRRLYPGCSTRHRFLLEGAAGMYSALVVVDDGDRGVWGARYNLQIDETP